jgi:hypothetical protein
MPRIIVDGVTIHVNAGTEVRIIGENITVTQPVTAPLRIEYDDGKRIVTRQAKTADPNAPSNRFQGHSTGKIEPNRLPKGLDRKIVAYMRKHEGKAYQRGISLALLPKGKRTELSVTLKHFMNDMVDTGELCILKAGPGSQILYGLVAMQDRNTEPQPQPEPINSWNSGHEHTGATELTDG